MEKEVFVPDIGDFEDVEVVEVLVSDGQQVQKEDALITLETDKAAMDVPAPFEGVVKKLKVTAGDRVSEGSLILVLDSGENDTLAPRKADSQSSDDSVAGPLSEVAVPDIGDFDDVEVIEVLVSVGDIVAVDDPLITLESDKAAMDIPAPRAGRIVEVAVTPGDRVSKGSIIVKLEGPADSAQQRGSPEPTSVKTSPESTPTPVQRPSGQLPAIDEQTFSSAHAGPSVRRFARELGVDLNQVDGTGHKRRILLDDVKGFVKAILSGATPVGSGLPELPQVDFAKFGEVETQALTRIQKISGPRLHAAWVNIPHVTQHDEADITELEAVRQANKAKAMEEGARLTLLAFVVKACMQALIEFPVFNSSLDAKAENLVFKKYFNIGFAADTPNGLMVPVIKDVDKKSILDVASDLGELSSKAREGKLKATDMQGGCFTISSLGGIGGTAFTPIINPPEVAILGLSRSYMKPIYRDDQFLPRLMLPMSLSYDHRVIDGAMAARFTTFLATIIKEMRDLQL